MAIIAYAISNTTIGPKEFAEMMLGAQVPFAVDGPGDLKPTKGSGLSTQIAAGWAVCGGSRVRITQSETVRHSSVSSGTAWDAIVIEVNFSDNTAALKTIRVTNKRDMSQSLTRSVGSRYQGIIAIAEIRAGAASVANVEDMRMWGGYGAPFFCGEGARSNMLSVDAPAGTALMTSATSDVVIKGANGYWSVYKVSAEEVAGKASKDHTHRSVDISDASNDAGRSTDAGKVLRSRAGDGRLFYYATPGQPVEIANKRYVDTTVDASIRDSDQRTLQEIRALTKFHTDAFAEGKWTFMRVGETVWCRVSSATVGEGLNLGKGSKYTPWMNSFTAALASSSTSGSSMPYVTYSNSTFTVKGSSGVKASGLFSYPAYS